jgi:hypothetical protein
VGDVPGKEWVVTAISGRGIHRIAGVVLLAALAAGCSTAPTPSSHLVPSVPTSVSPSATEPEPATAPEPTTIAAVPPCAATDLATTTVNSSAGLGTVGGSLRFQNDGPAACSLAGWPLVVGVTAAGVRTAARHATALLDYPTIEGTPTVVIGAGKSAFAAYAGGDTPAGTAKSCPPPFASLEVTAPGTTQPVTVSAYNAWFGHDLPSCVGIEVTPVVAASLVPSLESLRP